MFMLPNQRYNGMTPSWGRPFGMAQGAPTGLQQGFPFNASQFFGGQQPQPMPVQQQQPQPQPMPAQQQQPAFGAPQSYTPAVMPPDTASQPYSPTSIGTASAYSGMQQGQPQMMGQPPSRPLGVAQQKLLPAGLLGGPLGVDQFSPASMPMGAPTQGMPMGAPNQRMPMGAPTAMPPRIAMGAPQMGNFSPFIKR